MDEDTPVSINLPDINELAPALAEMQGEYETITKNRTVEIVMKSGGKFKYSYATLDHILESVRPHMKEHGFSLTNVVRDLTLTVLLIHKSGQFISLDLPLHTTSDPKALGSELTYMRRYGATCLLGIATDDDDDGDRAQVGSREAVAKKKRAVAKPRQPKNQTSDAAANEPTGGPGGGQDARIQGLWMQLRRTEATMREFSGDAEWSGEDWIRAKMDTEFGKASSKELETKEFNALMMALKKIELDNTPPADGPQE